MAKILIVDDSEMFRIELRAALEGGGHTIIEGKDGVDGLHVAKQHNDVDIVITDFNMPEMNGLQMVTMIKELPVYKSAPIFILTTETSPELKQHANKAGVMAWIIKPFVADKLLMGIEKVLKMKKAS